VSIRALTVEPGVAGSIRFDAFDEARAPEGHIEVETLLVGVCGTDSEIVAGDYGVAPHGADRLVLGHEAVARVTDERGVGGFAPGDLVVPIVRQPDPVPCTACAAGEWDMCENGRYTEHGIRGAHGFARDRWALDPAYAVAVPARLADHAVLVEPASVVAKAWEQIERIGARAHWRPERVLVTGAGPIGLLAALLARQRGFETHVLDRVTTPPKPELAAAVGAAYHASSVAETCPAPDVVIECTGAGPIVLDAIEHTSRSGIVCLTGISSGARTVEIDPAAINRRLVLENDVVFGTVNANRRHYEAAAEALAVADPEWLDGLITRRVSADRWEDAFDKRDDDVKVVLRFNE
jgi:threonine dehydrogenase-like Zn-dependent dehydrogenase